MLRVKYQPASVRVISDMDMDILRIVVCLRETLFFSPTLLCLTLDVDVGRVERDLRCRLLT